MLNDEGYTVLTIDYRLGMKGVKGVSVIIMSRGG